jgi:lysophospholipase L1-like esterase
MPTKKKLQTEQKGTARNDNLRDAIVAGRSTAQGAIAFRARQRRKRSAMQRAMPVRRRAVVAPAVPARTRALLGPRPTSGVLIAEGDSWFDYPLQDVLRLLEDVYLFEVESVAHKGDCVEDMAHTEGQFEEFARRLEKLLRDGKVPRAILLSGGGNDIAGDEFAILLNHAASSLPPLNEDIVRGVIDVRLRAAYASIISGLTTIADSYLNRRIPIITHGYDYPVPDGRGFLGGWWKLPGPWLQPGFVRKGYNDLTKNTTVVEQLIDRFNEMLAAISAHRQFSHVHYLDLRKTLRRDNTYKKFWANELHPTAGGFDLVTKKFADIIESLP